MKTPTSEQLIPLLPAVIALIPSHGVRYTVLRLLLAAAILCKIHLQPPSVQISQLKISLNHTEEYIQEVTVEAPRSYSNLRDQMRRLCENKGVQLEGISVALQGHWSAHNQIPVALQRDW
ncbi:hypothetical protein DFH08DRAFT_815890 [Mycena albidolilacea]|uniref:Uncharacterized protein n=1 Tax=Mycena albidolilacea TaxID=1033008 RepID=A0AAD6ZLK0_9AGAR|nr:hypothetical protein DFH08DRAFT_815890 [Mycena albidolilacea]